MGAELLGQNVPLEDVQHLVEPLTARLDDRRADRSCNRPR